MLSVIAIDDEPPALKIITAYCNQISNINFIDSYTSVSKAENTILSQTVDLILLDIQLTNTSGITWYQSLENPPMVIFTTAFSNYAIDGFNVAAIDFLLKPFSFDRFHKAITKAQEFKLFKTAQETTPSFLFIKADQAIQKVYFEDILYIESLDDYIKVHLTKGRSILSRNTLKNIIELLPSNFQRVHRSYVVNMMYVTKVKQKIIHMNDVHINLSHTYENSFMQLFFNQNNADYHND